MTTPSRVTSRVTLVLALLAGGLTATAPAGAAGAENVTARLVADVTAIKPGEPFTVGVLLDVAPQWHVYWSNPGDSGLATSVKFQVPDGFTVGELRFPTPVRFNQPGDVVGFGYEGAVLLTATVTPPATLAEKSVPISAKASWLVCHDVCLPGRAKLDLPPLSVATQAQASAEQALFQKWAGAVPTEASASGAVAKMEWAADDATKGRAVLTVTWKEVVRWQSVALFPTADDAVDVRTVSVRTEGNRTRVTVGVRVLAGKKPKGDALPAVLGFTDKEGGRRGVNMNIPVAASGDKAATKGS